MNLASLNELFNDFSRQKLVSSVRNKLAKANESYIVTTTSKKKYVIKVLETQSVESLKVEASIQEKIIAGGIVSPRYLQLSNGEILGKKKDKFFAVSEYIDGKREASVVPRLFFEMGGTLAKIHQSLTAMTVPFNSAQWLCLDNARHELDIYSGPLKNDLSNLLNDNIGIFGCGLPESVIHGDLTFSNIFTSSDKVVAVFDFETSENTLRILDIARTYLSLRREVDFPSAMILKQLTDGYNAVATDPLTDLELINLRSAINYAAAACAVWCVNHDQDNSARAYLGIVKADMLV